MGDQSRRETITNKPRHLNDSEFVKEMEWRKLRDRNLNVSYKISQKNRDKNAVRRTIVDKTGIDLGKARLVREEEEEGRFRVQFKTIEEKKEIMRQKESLKVTDIWVDDDLTKRQMEIMKWLKVVAKNEEVKGNYSMLGYMKIFVNDTWMRWNELKGDLEPFRRTSP